MNLDSIISRDLRTTEFGLLCVSSVLFMGSFNMIIPELPNYITQMGGAEFKGLIISLFALTAALSRPFSGKLADLVGRRPVMIFGALAAAVSSAIYPLISGLSAFFVLRLIHGLSTGFKPTGTTAYLADIVGDKNRGEALGMLGMAGSMGMAAGPAIGSAIALNFGLDAMFTVSSVVGFLSAACVVVMKESVHTTTKFNLKMLIIRKDEVIDKDVFPSSFVMLMTTYSFGLALTIIPDFSDFLQVMNRGLFFTVMLVSSVVTRLFAGKASDRYGRVKLLLSGTAALTATMTILAFTTNQVVFFVGAVFFGISTGINSPTLFAWTVDLANPEKRGKAIATMFIALEIGILSGALISAEIYANDSSGFPLAFGSGAVLAMAAFSYLLVRKRRLKNLLPSAK
ncbi:MAG TPA: MFS transporter [Cryomorphaceae bacterium]|nr:MFS transporter [Cryomorphaceae bacterium]